MLFIRRTSGVLVSEKGVGVRDLGGCRVSLLDELVDDMHGLLTFFGLGGLQKGLVLHWREAARENLLLA